MEIEHYRLSNKADELTQCSIFYFDQKTKKLQTNHQNATTELGPFFLPLEMVDLRVNVGAMLLL